MRSKIFESKKDIIKEISFYLKIPSRVLDRLERVDIMTLLNILVHLEAKEKLS